jgi:RluA family pseudouridine synthase
LDRETSGLLVVAKTPESFESLRRQFRERHVEKIYLALAWGKSPAKGVINCPLAHDPGDKRRMRVIVTPLRKNRLKVWPAATRYRRLKTARGLSLLEVEMASGVTHQIRVHLASSGHPIVADRLYGDPRAETFALQRHFLHAWKLRFDHPAAGGRLNFEAGLPKELRALLTQLEMDL